MKDLARIGREVTQLAERKGSLIVAHNYVYPELQEVAAAVWDSLGLSLIVRSRSAPRVDFCGVWFMGETAKIILGDRSRVYMPDRPGCSLVTAIDHRVIDDWIARYPDGILVSYVNTDAATKAISHYVCTSANATQILNHVSRVHPDRRILFLPDKFLGMAALPDGQRERARIDLYDGACHVHAAIELETIKEALDRHPHAELLIHPECACSAEKTRSGALPAHSHFLSSEQMVRHAESSPAGEFIVATENGLVYRLRKDCPGKKFHPISGTAVCEYMKMNTIEKLHASLRNDRFEGEVDLGVRCKAYQAVERMLAIH